MWEELLMFEVKTQAKTLTVAGRNSQKYCSVGRLYRKHTRALTFENFAVFDSDDFGIISNASKVSGFGFRRRV